MRVNEVSVCMPCHFNTLASFRNSVLKDLYLESVAHSIVVHCKNCNQDTWTPFTFKDFSFSMLPRVATQAEQKALDHFVKIGFLDVENDTYCVNNTFVVAFAQFSNVANKGFAMPAYA